MISAPPCSVSSDLGQLVVMRHLISGIDWAIAGAAMVAAPATPIPVTLMKSRRFIDIPSPADVTCQPSFRGLGPSMEHPAPDFHVELGHRDELTYRGAKRASREA